MQTCLETGGGVKRRGAGEWEAGGIASCWEGESFGRPAPAGRGSRLLSLPGQGLKSTRWSLVWGKEGSGLCSEASDLFLRETHA